MKGKRFGRLVVMERAKENKGAIAQWVCLCDCGKTKIVTGCNLRNGNTQSCGCLRRMSYKKVFAEMVGEKHGKLTITDFFIKDGLSYFGCICDCGKETTLLAGSVKSGGRTTCGCSTTTKPRTENGRFIVKHGNTQNGKAKPRLYTCWLAMKSRCYNRNNIEHYKHYGARGISVCDEWANDYVAFKKWSMANGYNDSLTLDRIDVNGSYSPENCRWATVKEQCRNKRNNHWIAHNGETHSMAEWAEIKGMNYGTLYSRIGQRKMSYANALETPVIKSGLNLSRKEQVNGD